MGEELHTERSVLVLSPCGNSHAFRLESSDFYQQFSAYRWKAVLSQLPTFLWALPCSWRSPASTRAVLEGCGGVSSCYLLLWIKDFKLIVLCAWFS